MPTYAGHRKRLQALTRKYKSFLGFVTVYLTSMVNYLNSQDRNKPEEKKAIQAAHATMVGQTAYVLEKEGKIKEDKEQQQMAELKQELEAQGAGVQPASSTPSGHVSEAEQRARDLECAASLLLTKSVLDAATVRRRRRLAANAHRDGSKLPCSALQLSDASMRMLNSHEQQLFCAVRVSLSMPATF